MKDPISDRIPSCVLMLVFQLVWCSAASAPTVHVLRGCTSLVVQVYELITKQDFSRCQNKMQALSGSM